MEILIGTILAGITEIVKIASAKFGKKITTTVIYIFLFTVSLIWSFLQWKGIITAEMITEATTILASSIAVYELLIKRIAQPLLRYNIEK